MSKNRLYGYKKWYGYKKIKKVKGEKGKSYFVPKRIKRKQTNGQYKLYLSDGKKEIQVNNRKFINELHKFKTAEIRNRKFNIGNILFKLKIKGKSKNLEDADKVVRDISIKKQTEKLRKYSIKKQKEKCKDEQKPTRNKLEKILNKSPEIINNKSVSYGEINIHIFTDIDKFREEVGYGILIEKSDKDMLRKKRDLYNKLKKINTNIYKIANEVIKNKNSVLNNRFYKDKSKEEILGCDSLNEVIKSFDGIKELINNNPELEGFYNFKLSAKTTSNNKELFKRKLEFYYNNSGDLTKEDIVDFIIGELDYYSHIKRYEKKFKIIDKNLEKRLIKTYIENDKHNTYKSNENDAYKSLLKLIEEDKFENEFNEIYRKFNVKELAEKVEKFYKEKPNKEDTYPYKILKDHYNKHIKKKCDFDNTIEDYQKIIYREIYKYLKGRINKCVNNKKFIDFGITENNYNLVKNKTLNSLKQNILERIIYVGKRKKLGIESAEEFIKSHALEELNLEILAFFGTANMHLNRYIKDMGTKYVDFFGSKIEKQNRKSKEKIKIDKFDNEVLHKLKFTQEEKFIDFINEIFKLRSYIIHANNKKLENLIRNQQKLGNYYKDIEIAINQMKARDEEICKSLNTHIIFKGKEDLLKKVNEMKVLSNKLSKYMPSFSKIVPEIKREYEERAEEIVYDNGEIILNAIYYYLSIFYQKSISNENSEYVKYIKKKIEKDDDISNDISNVIENMYKSAQKRASKGEKKAIHKFQNKFINWFIEFLKEKETYKEIFNIKIKKEKLKDDIKSIKYNEAYNIYSIKQDIQINNDFEYIISACALLSDANTVNKIRNRFKSTQMWLSEYQNQGIDYDNIIKVLDEIIKINRDKDILLNTLNDSEIQSKNQEKFKKLTESNVEEYFYKKVCERIKAEEADEELRKTEIEIIKTLRACIRLKKKGNNGKTYGDFSYIFSDLEKKYELEIKYPKDPKNKKDINDVVKVLEKVQLKNIEDVINQGKKIIKKYNLNNVLSEIIKEINQTNYLEECKKEFVKDYSNRIADVKEIYDDKFSGIYYQKKLEGEEYPEIIFKKKMYKNITNPNFKKLYDKFLKSKLEELKEDELYYIKDSKSLKEIIDRTHYTLRSLNDNTKGFSKAYKDNLKKKIKKEDDNDKKNAIFNNIVKYKNKANQVETLDYQEFIDDFNKTQAYNQTKRIVEFDILNEIQEYLVNINWKLLIQIYRLERDIHYIVNGLEVMKYFSKDELDRKDDKSKPFLSLKGKSLEEKFDKKIDEKITECHYQFDLDSYKKLAKVCKYFGLDLLDDDCFKKEGQDSIRNYIAHFYIVREPFNKKSILEVINEVNKLLKYRSKYNQSTFHSCFEVFKRNINIDYDRLKKIDMLKEEELDKIISIKKVTMLELESRKMSLEIIKDFLKYKE